MGFLTPFGVVICLICYASWVTNMAAYMSGMKINPAFLQNTKIINTFILAFLLSNKVFKKTLCTQYFKCVWTKAKDLLQNFFFPFKSVIL